jgi:hypothetical protein
MKEQIFISYKRVDKERVFAIKDFIEQNTGAKCWIDLEGIKSDAQFASIIISAIREAEIFLFMYSNAHGNINLDIDWTIRELNFAEKRGKRIVFINIDQSPLTDWFELMFGTKQQIDATNSDMLNRLCDDLCSWLGILKPAAEQDSESQKKAKRDALPESAIKSEGKTPKTAKREALPEEPFLVDNLMYKASGNGGVSVCGCDKSLREVHIPEKVEYNGYTYDVDSIGECAFGGCLVLTSITIPNSVVNIGDNTFRLCKSLTSITIPNSVTSIGAFAFFECKSLTSITIPDSVTSIGERAFGECSSLREISISNKLTSIGKDAIPEHTRVSERGNWSFLLPHNR